MTKRWNRARRIAGRLVFGTVALGLLVAAYGRFIEFRRPRLEMVEVPLPPGHDQLADLLIGFLTDIHFGPFIAPTDLERGAAFIRWAKPDLLLLGGDFISESPRFAPRLAALLGRVADHIPLGTYAVLGNHDLSTNRQVVAEALTRAGIRVLRNESVRVDTGGGPLWIVGGDDTILGDPDLPAAFAAVPAGAASIALWHEPDDAAIAAELGAFLQLSGHSHGGQVRLPGVGPLVLPPGGRRFPCGRYLVDGMVLYVSRGLGAYRPPVRLNCPPEVTLIRLTRSHRLATWEVQ